MKKLKEWAKVTLLFYSSAISLFTMYQLTEMNSIVFMIMHFVILATYILAQTN